MRRIEKEEERLSFTEPDKQCFHLCIVNLGQSVLSSQHHVSLSPYPPSSTSILFFSFYLPSLLFLSTVLYLYTFPAISLICLPFLFLFIPFIYSSLLSASYRAHVLTLILTHSLTYSPMSPFLHICPSCLLTSFQLHFAV